MIPRQLTLKNIRVWLVAALLIGAPFSLQPSLSLPLYNFPSLRIGLYQVIAAAFVLACLPLIYAKRRQLVATHLFAGTSLLVIILVVGLLSSEIVPRTVVASLGVIGLYLLGLASYVVYGELTQSFMRRLLTWLLWSGVVFGSLALVQLIFGTLDTTGLGTLCANCTSGVFGFPRINLFAAEPQFLANSLLPVFFAAFYSKRRDSLRWWSLILTSIAIGLTFSRGAFVALFIGLIIAIILAARYRRPILRRTVTATLVACGALLISFGLLIGSATYRYRSSYEITYNTTVSMIDQLSLGTINFAQKTPPPITPVAPQTDTSFTPQGFVEASSNDRLASAKIIITSWRDDLRTVLFGLGLGNIGTYINNHSDTKVAVDHTTYIFYVLLLGSTGLLGLGLFCWPFIYLLWRGWRDISSPGGLFLYSLTVAFLVQFFFFGTFINTMYIYVWLGLAVAYVSRRPQKQRTVST